jgi:Flp pilus assembly protein TadD
LETARRLEYTCHMTAATWAFVVGLLAAQSLDKAVSALEDGRLEEAIQTLSEILSHAPDDPDANYYLGLAHYRQGHTQEARPLLERAARLAPSNASVWKALGTLQVAGNNLQGAAVSLGKACSLAPGAGDSCYLQGRVLYSLGRYEEAREPLDRSLRTAAPEDLAKVHRAMALNFDELRLPQDAERHFRDAVRYYRSSTGVVEDPRVGYGAFLIRRGRALEALELLRQAVAASHDSPRAHAELGRALLDLDRPEAALPPLQRAVELDPNRWAVRMLLGKVYLRLGRTEEGEREIRISGDGLARQDHGSSSIK